MIKDKIEILERLGVNIYVHTIDKDGKEIYQVGCADDNYTEEYETMEDLEDYLALLVWAHVNKHIAERFIK